MEHKKIIVLSAMHKRQNTVKHCLEKMPFVDKYMIYSDDDDGAFLQHTDVKGVKQVPNNPLSLKWNQAVVFLKNIEFDAVILLGSDDFIDEKFISFVSENISKYDLISFGKSFFIGCTLHSFDRA